MSTTPEPSSGYAIGDEEPEYVGYRKGDRLPALLLALQSGSVTIADLLRLPVYREANSTTIYNDIRQLRQSGYLISSHDGKFFLECNPIDLSSAHIGTLSAIRYICRSAAWHTAPSRASITKLLGYGDDPGDFSDAIDVASVRYAGVASVLAAIQHRKRIRFQYCSTRHCQVRSYVVEPYQIGNIRGSFYLRGYQCEPSVEDGQRVYKMSRIVGGIEELAQTVEDRDGSASKSALDPVAATLLAFRYIPLLERADEVRPAAGGGFVCRFCAIDRRELYEDLVFYGADTVLCAPPSLVADFRARMIHIRAITQRVGRFDE
ncbi:helix-turn-helix transcriptional regulator [Trueperella sp. LYQ143]|uniref:helix-turn-helix transcriptional regulator n=1 Tax=unclassified Trueperella TaxID=2630174 RepID=UPI0039831655